MTRQEDCTYLYFKESGKWKYEGRGFFPTADVFTIQREHIVAAVAAWVTHVYVCIQASAWILLAFGCIVAPVGIIHGIGVWLGAF
ncbi:hypothetical protein RGK87_04470 [Agrobacterium fabacearum]|uniref:hypothetical protein n=1 Tax=Agrobacterium tumefaciens TaxID=358 RepID=UPI0028535C46|nr:hypothetical protein [Agrobacterium tumefaciens]MDR5008262.1 hypothetical protein [Agrobacterium tumefaciens]